MTKAQAEKRFGTQGTIKSRKQWSLAIRRSKMPNKHRLNTK